MQVTIAGVAATVISSTATSILAIAPPFAALGPGASLNADVGVSDLMSGGSTYMYGALAYPSTSLPPQSPGLTMLSPVFYVAAGLPVGITPLVSLSTDGAAAPDLSVTWSAAVDGIAYPNGAQSISDSNGLASIAATAGALQSAAQVTGSACAQMSGPTPVCGSFIAVGVDPSLWTLTLLEGATQTVAATSILQPVVFQVTDSAGHPVIGVPATVYQAVTAYQICPAHGACPIAETYQTSESSATSDANGLITVTTQQLFGIPQITTIAVSAGTQGFISVSLNKTP